jgi:uncharacterized cupin superfamily protein
MIPEAPLEPSEYGLVATSPGWFVVNVRDAAWVTSELAGSACIIEGGPYEFPQIGYTIGVLHPGRPSGLYHREANQEDFLVLSGACTLLVEGQARALTAWDFVHCPANTEHILVGAGDRPCVVLMIGAREGWPDAKGIVYPRSELALRHGAGVEQESDVPKEAYAAAGFPRWKPGPPETFAGLPWA